MSDRELTKKETEEAITRIRSYAPFKKIPSVPNLDCMCGQPFKNHVAIHKPFGMDTVIGGPIDPPLVILCPTAVYRPVTEEDNE